MAKGEVSYEAIAQRVFSGAGQDISWPTAVQLAVRAMQELEAHRGEDIPEEDETTEVIEDLDLVYNTLDKARQWLLEEAQSANLARRHNLESAVAAFESIGILFKAEGILHQLLDPEEDGEEPEDLPAEPPWRFADGS